MKTLGKLVALCLVFASLAQSQPTVDGQFVVMTNDGTHYYVKVQLKANAPTGVGTTTLSFNFTNTNLSFPATASLVAGTDYIYNPSFATNPGTYDALTVTRPTTTRVSINISYAGANGAGLVIGTSYTDVAQINFTIINPAGSSGLTWVTKQVFDDDNATQWTNGSFLNENTSPLPVELVNFTALARGRNIDLSWSTKTETNNYGFDVERLNASSTWDKVGFVEGKGTTSAPQSYSYKDVVKSAGTVTYRLKQTDRDGKFTYSSQVEAKAALSPEDYKLSQNYPNPFNPTTKLNFAVNATEQVAVRVFNNLGQEVKTLFNGIAQADQVYDVTFDGAGLSSGTYYYVLKAKDRFEVKKMVMMK